MFWRPQINDIPELEVLSRDIPRTLYHYTGATALLGILSSRSIWASHLEHVNDDRELLYVEDLIREVSEEFFEDIKLDREAVAELRTQFSRVNSRVSPGCSCVVSFSKEPDLLSQWERYAGHHGYSIGFDFKAASQVFNTSGRSMVRVVYDRDEQKEILKAVLRNSFERLDERQSGDYTEELLTMWAVSHAVALFSVGLGFKHKAFTEEGEWRSVVYVSPDEMELLNFRAGPFGVIPYTTIPVELNDDIFMSEVRIGRTHYFEESKRAVELALTKYGVEMSRAKVIESEVHLRR